METTPDPNAARDTLRAAERAAAAPFVDYPPTPVWYPPALGGWFAILSAIMVYRPGPAVSVPLLVVLIALVGAFMAWHSRVRGTLPTLTGAPKELHRPMYGYAAGVVVIVAVVVPVGLFAPPIAAVIATFVLVTIGIAAYERAYFRAAQAVKERLA
ncbi:hypothetical protein [Gordonia spumicola]|nr:hypothetical protein [Gordonia spumicola]